VHLDACLKIALIKLANFVARENIKVYIYTQYCKTLQNLFVKESKYLYIKCCKADKMYCKRKHKKNTYLYKNIQNLANFIARENTGLNEELERKTD